jgi:hypothetical protein
VLLEKRQRAYANRQDADFEVAADGHVEAHQESGTTVAKIFAGS